MGQVLNMVSWWLLMPCASLFAANARASPFEVGGLDASDQYELKILTEIETSSSETILEGPAFDATIPIAGGLEASVTGGVGRLTRNGQNGSSGVLDTEIAMKYELISVPGSGGFGLAIEPALFLPTGTNGLSEDEWRFAVPLIVGIVRGPWEARAQVSYELGFESDEAEFGFGFLVQRQLTDRLALGAELVGSTPSVAFDETDFGANIGFALALSNVLELQGRLGHSIGGNDGEAVTNGGMFLEMAF